MSVFAVVPVKDLPDTKSRLSASLDPAGRRALTLTMLHHVLSILEKSGRVERVGVVSPSPRVLSLAEDAGVSALLQESRGLNEALGEGRYWALLGGAASLLVLPADLPYLSASDVRGVLDARGGDGRRVVVSPDDARRGTNALLLRPPDALPFAFGPGSYEAHLRAAGERGLEAVTYESSGLALDLDTPEDLMLLRESGRLPS